MATVFLGVGGGIIIVPLLPLLTGCSHAQAVATSLFTLAAALLVNCIQFYRLGLIQVSRFAAMALLCGVCSFFAAFGPRVLPASWLKVLLAAVLFKTAHKLWADLRFWETRRDSSPAVQVSIPQEEHPGIERTTKQRLGLGPRELKISLLAGAISGLTGIGAGLIVTPFLMIHRLVAPAQVVPTANFIMLMTTLLGALSLGLNFGGGLGSLVLLKEGILMFAVSSVFSGQTVSMQARLPERRRKQILLVLTVSLALRVIYSVF